MTRRERRYEQAMNRHEAKYREQKAQPIPRKRKPKRRKPVQLDLFMDPSWGDGVRP
jgi:hypothetical protein